MDSQAIYANAKRRTAGFAGSIIFSFVAVELLTDILQHHALYEVALGFGFGVATMLGLRYFTQYLEKQAETASELLAL